LPGQPEGLRACPAPGCTPGLKLVVQLILGVRFVRITYERLCVVVDDVAYWSWRLESTALGPTEEEIRARTMDWVLRDKQEVTG
jgi:hypothetical protein